MRFSRATLHDNHTCVRNLLIQLLIVVLRYRQCGDGDTIRLLPGLYHDTPYYISKSIRIESTDGAQITIIDLSGLAGPRINASVRCSKNVVCGGYMHHRPRFAV